MKRRMWETQNFRWKWWSSVVDSTPFISFWLLVLEGSMSFLWEHVSNSRWSWIPRLVLEGLESKPEHHSGSRDQHFVLWVTWLTERQRETSALDKVLSKKVDSFGLEDVLLGSLIIKWIHSRGCLSMIPWQTPFASSFRLFDKWCRTSFSSVCLLSNCNQNAL